MHAPLLIVELHFMLFQSSFISNNRGAHGAGWQAQTMGLDASECALLNDADAQMLRAVSLEDSYWHSHFFQEPYYVAGRSYDQYRPAYKLGWQSALQCSDSSFVDLSKQIELQWVNQCGSSLLPWREVHLAVKNAWVHARAQMQKEHQHAATLLKRGELQSLVRPLYQECLILIDDLQRMRGVRMSDFAHQVFDRHIRMLQILLQGLRTLIPQDTLMIAGGDWPKRLRSQWWKLRASALEREAAQFFEACEFKERNLLGAYQNVMREPLSLEVKELLQLHAKQLQSHIEKLHWVRHNVAL